VSVDGEDARARLARYAELISAATPQGLMDKAAISFMNGPVGSRVALKLRDGAGAERDVTLPRKAEDYTTLYHRERTGDVVTVLPGNIGYVDLDRLTIPMVDDMFERLKNTTAIVFDMRGYPNGTVWAIAPRLSSGDERVALLETPMVGHDAPGVAVEAFYQTIGPTPPGARLYTGKTVMLVDERTVSQAEHTGLYLLAANGTKFVGSPSAGTDGEITTIALPGGITVGFTGQSVRYPDGRELQGRGLVPDVLVTPTIKGIRAGRDEVLERAIAYLEQN
jgi:C-terminal processing protease CtpA/Prc